MWKILLTAVYANNSYQMTVWFTYLNNDAYSFFKHYSQKWSSNLILIAFILIQIVILSTIYINK